MTTTLRVVLHDGPQTTERRYLNLPVRLGRGPGSDCWVFDTEVSRSHAILDVEGGEVVLRDLNSQNGTYFNDAASTHCLRGGAARFRDGRAEFVIGRVRVIAIVEDLQAAQGVPSALALALRSAATEVLEACAPPGFPPNDGTEGATSSDEATTRQLVHVLNTSFRSLLAVRAAIRETDVGTGLEAAVTTPHDELTAALLKWTQATSLALRLLEHGVQASHDRSERATSEAAEAVDALLRELAPERLEGDVSDVRAESPATHASANWARYRMRHRKLVERHSRMPGLLLGQNLGDSIEARRRAGARATDDVAPVSERRARVLPELVDDTPPEPGPACPSSSR